MNCQNSAILIGDMARSGLEELICDLHATDRRIFLLTDENTNKLCQPILEQYFGVFSSNVMVLESGESSKDLETVYHLWEEMLESGADRNSVLMNLGGGVVTDIGGFVASTFKRGIEFVNIPTTLLAMVDASIGGKTGINMGPAKNQVGTFAWPTSVFILPEMLSTLPEAVLRSGYGECLKHGLLHSQDLFNTIMHLGPEELDSDLLESIIELKTEVVNKDPLEQNKRKCLNLGHTIGHAIESLALHNNKPITHGSAVILGLMAELRISEKLLGLDTTYLTQVSDIAKGKYPELQTVQLDRTHLLRFMKMDKKNEQGNIRFALLKNVGECEVDISVPEDIIMDAIEHIQLWQSS